VIALIASPTTRTPVALPDGRAGTLVRHGAMIVYAHGTEIRYEAEVELVPGPLPGRPTRRLLVRRRG
jgi:hypothetical protein